MKVFETFLTEDKACARARKLCEDHASARELAGAQATAEARAAQAAEGEAPEVDVLPGFSEADKKRLEELAVLLTGPYQKAVTQVVLTYMPDLFHAPGEA